MISTSAAMTTSATHTGAWPNTRIEMYSHQVPEAYRPRPKQKPSSAPSRGAGAPRHSSSNVAGASSASHHRPCGAKAAVSAAPASSAAARRSQTGCAQAARRRVTGAGSATVLGGGDAVVGGRLVLRRGDAHGFHAAPVGAHDAELESVQLDRLATAWQPAEMLRDQPGDGVDGLVGKRGVEEFVELADARAPAHQELAVALAADVLLVLDVVFVVDLADDLLDHVLDGDQAGNAAVFVHRDRHVVAAD